MAAAATTSIRISGVSVRGPCIWAVICFFFCPIVRELDQKQNSGSRTSARLTDSGLNYWATMLAPVGNPLPPETTPQFLTESILFFIIGFTQSSKLLLSAGRRKSFILWINRCWPDPVAIAVGPSNCISSTGQESAVSGNDREGAVWLNVAAAAPEGCCIVTSRDDFVSLFLFGWRTVSKENVSFQKAGFLSIIISLFCFCDIGSGH